MEHFVENETKSPNITLGSVGLIFQYLKGHVQRGTNNGLDLLIFGYFFSKTKISNLENFILDHDIGGFQIPVDNTFSNKYQEPITNLGQHVDTKFLIELFFWHYDLGDISIAQFLNDVVIFATFHDVNKLDDVWVVYWLHDLDLLEEGVL